MKVYIATSGSYSDYSIDNVFATEELAAQYAATQYDGGVEEYDVHEEPVERRMMHSLCWLSWLPDREAATSHNASPSVYALGPQDYDPEQKMMVTWTTTHFGERLNITGWDKQDVMKVYSEQRAVFLAKKEGIS